MTQKSLTSLLFLFALMPAPLVAQVPVHLTGHSAADDTLQNDIVKTIALYGDAFHCPAPSEITASMLNSSMIPSSLRKPSLNTSYEHWDATFCAKHYSFFVTFFPDPNGGSFLSVAYPYPTTAPR
jgi:hypothetical protein